MQVNGISLCDTVERVAAYKAEVDSPFALMPREILKEIFSYLSADLKSALKVCHRWKDNVTEIIPLKDKEALEKYAAFGAAEWKKYFDKDVEAPPIPRGIFAWLDRPSVKTEGPDGKNGESGLLFLRPAGLSLNSMEDLHKKATGGEYINYDFFFRNQYGTDFVGEAEWVWMSKALLLNSRDKSYEEQKSIVTALGKGYELPKALDAVVLNIVWYVSHEGQRLFGDSPSTYTRCQETNYGRWGVLVGNFVPRGLHVPYMSYVTTGDGVAPCRKFRSLGFGT